MRVWLDDIRLMPEGYDVHAKTAEQIINLLKTGEVTKISLDHDLGEYGGTGYEVAKYIEKAAYYKEIPKLEWRIHSANPVGIIDMMLALKNADRFWERNLEEP